ncbi:hypothetical protein [uncultured Shewanella sp.]|uniref:hypothetical protein n=1 Tax=uncultured Shewanella sp. TaxID=173975 RepID=UPI0026199D1C|nr:hypothetical protein [uncultured Shewanella sp.]
MPIITNQQLNTLKGGGRELFPALNVDLNQSRNAIVNLSITVMFTGLDYGAKECDVKVHENTELIMQAKHFKTQGENKSKINDEIYNNEYIKTTTHQRAKYPNRYQHQFMQLNLTSNLPDIDNRTNLHTFRCPAIDNEFKIFHCHIQFLKQKKTVSIVPILNTSNSTIEGINNACGQYIISFL